MPETASGQTFQWSDGIQWIPQPDEPNFNSGDVYQAIPLISVGLCQMCGNRLPQEEIDACANEPALNGPGDLMCASCRSFNIGQCSECHRRSVLVSGVYGGSGPALCRICNYSRVICVTCGEYIRSSSQQGYLPEEMCQTCLGGGFVQPYGSSVPLVPIGYGPVYFGVELEIECMGSDSTHSYARQIRPRYSDNFAIMKHDGSLNNGFEIVTRPASLMIHRDEWSKILNPTINGIRSYRTTTCGFHVHCSRRPLSEIQVAKIVCFVNAECNSKLIELIAGRVSDRWSRIAPKKLSDGNKANTERYEAVNLQNRETIEFRIFKGTLKYESLMKNIEFCDALIRYMAPASRMLQEYLDTEQFVRFALCERRFNKTLNRNVRRWPHLAAFLEAKWLNVKSASAEKYGFKRPDMKSAQTEEEI